jgi:hypothetical protein
MAAFTSIIDDVLANNLKRCMSYEQVGVTLPGVSKASKSYTGWVIYESNEAKMVGTISIKIQILPINGVSTIAMDPTMGDTF